MDQPAESLVKIHHGHAHLRFWRVDGGQRCTEEIGIGGGCGLIRLAPHYEIHGFRQRVARRADLRQAWIILPQQVNQLRGLAGAAFNREANFEESVRLALLRRIELGVARAQDARLPIVVPEHVLADFVSSVHASDPYFGT